MRFSDVSLPTKKKTQRLLLTSCIVLPSIVANFLQGICIQNAYQNSNLFAIFSWFILSIIIGHFLASQSVKINKKGNGQTFIMIIRHHIDIFAFMKTSLLLVLVSPLHLFPRLISVVCVDSSFMNSLIASSILQQLTTPHTYAMVFGGFSYNT